MPPPARPCISILSAPKRFSYSFTTRTFVQGLVQYNDRADLWSMNFRFGWLQDANTGLFVVYTDTRGLYDLFDRPDPRNAERCFVARQVRKLQEAGIPVFAIQTRDTADIFRNVRNLGHLTGRDAAADSLGARNVGERA